MQRFPRRFVRVNEKGERHDFNTKEFSPLLPLSLSPERGLVKNQLSSGLSIVPNTLKTAPGCDRIESRERDTLLYSDTAKYSYEYFPNNLFGQIPDRRNYAR